MVTKPSSGKCFNFFGLPKELQDHIFDDSVQDACTAISFRAHTNRVKVMSHPKTAALLVSKAFSYGLLQRCKVKAILIAEDQGSEWSNVSSTQLTHRKLQSVHFRLSAIGACSEGEEYTKTLAKDTRDFEGITSYTLAQVEDVKHWNAEVTFAESTGCSKWFQKMEECIRQCAGGKIHKPRVVSRLTDVFRRFDYKLHAS